MLAMNGKFCNYNEMKSIILQTPKSLSNEYFLPSMLKHFIKNIESALTRA